LEAARIHEREGDERHGDDRPDREDADGTGRRNWSVERATDRRGDEGPCDGGHESTLRGVERGGYHPIEDPSLRRPA
jgi:hypothetical protein